LEVNASELSERPPGQRRKQVRSRIDRTKVEADVRCGPAGKRAAQDAHTELADDEAGKITGDRAAIADLGHNRRRSLALGDEVEPLAGLEDDAIVEGVERPPRNFAWRKG